MERIILEFLVIIASLVSAIVDMAKKNTRQFNRFKNNHLTELQTELTKQYTDLKADFGEKFGRLDERMKSAESDIKYLYNRVNEHINHG